MDIRRFFVSSKPAAQKPSQDGTLNTEKESTKKKSVSTDEEVKKKNPATKITSPKVEKKKKKKKDNDKKRKRRAVIESDSEEEVVEQKQKAQKPNAPLPPAPLPPAKKDPVQYVSETDSDSDNFLSLKKSQAKPQGNGVTKPGKARNGTKESHVSPPKPTLAPATGKGGMKKKSPPAPVTPKSAPPQTKRTPTSVLDYFGSGSVQRSDRKLVASTKRKTDPEESLTDEVIAQQLHMDEDMELERQAHEDEEFAKTLAMLDQQPHAKKVKSTHTHTLQTLSSTSPEESEKKRGNSSAFRSFLNRDGPRALGSKPIPTGAENCLEGCVFVISGVLESMEREDAKSLIERNGGKVTGNISKRTTYLVMGRDGGAAKTEKAEGFGTKILDEDGLLELIRSTPGKKSKYLIACRGRGEGNIGALV
uniref:BRCT domain-containing protein n=1 Tax=Oncorhynchus kisutch TaxID=8019 RepID=A0A8C7HIS1_ONCKI